VRILVTNDDGIHADGLSALERIARRLSDDVCIAAPEHEQSGASRALTLSEPLRVRRLDPKRFAISGTPTDCVMLAVEELFKDHRPDLVLSGVNRGHNTAEDVTMSGTVAGAIQGMALGVPAIALSQSLAVFHDDEVAHYETAEAFAPGIIERLLEAGWPKDVIININFPNRPAGEVEAVEVTRQGFRDIHNMKAERRTDLRGRDYYWMGFTHRRPDVAEGTDLAAVLAGRISVTPLHIDLTHMPTVHALRGVLGGPPPKLRSHA
jgi:5'-nucleotidase